MFEECMMSSEGCDCESGQPISEACFKDEVSEKSRGACHRELYKGGTLAGLEHFPRCKWGISFADHLMMVGGAANAIMQNVAGQSFHFRTGRHRKRLVNISAFPRAASSVEKSQLIIWVPSSSLDPASHIK